MRIGYASGDWGSIDPAGEQRTLGGAGWYRMGIPAAEIDKHDGYSTVLGTLIRSSVTDAFGLKTWDGELHWDFDLIVMQRWMSEGLDDEIRWARAIGQVIVQDIDDAFWHLDPRNQAWAATHPKVNPLENRDHYRKSLAASNAITTTTPWLAERLRFRGVETIIVPNAIDLARWHPHRVDRTPTTIGWVGSQPWRSGDLETLHGILGPVVKRQRARWYHGGNFPGSTPASVTLGLGPRVTSEIRDICPIGQYPGLFDPIDIGVVPLADRPFNYAKTALKGIEFAAAGVPFVAAALPSYRELATMHGIGRTAGTKREWFDGFNELATRDRRVELGRLYRERVRALDIARTWTNWTDTYEQILSSVPAWS